MGGGGGLREEGVMVGMRRIRYPALHDLHECAALDEALERYREVEMQHDFARDQINATLEMTTTAIMVNIESCWSADVEGSSE